MAKNRSKLLSRDPHGVWAERLADRRQMAAAAMYQRLAYLSAAYWGVKMGRDCTFYGPLQFRRAAGSRLQIGDRCRFRSAAWSNPGGMTRPCRLVTMAPDAELILGCDCGLSGTVITAAESIVIGDRVMCGLDVTILDTDAHGTGKGQRQGGAARAPIRIDHDVFIGLSSVVLKGVHIGEGSYVGALSVVTHDIPSGVIAAGNPARVIREIRD